MQQRELAIYLNPAGPQRRAIMQDLAEAGIHTIGVDGCQWPPEVAEAEIEQFRQDCDDFALTVYSMHAIPPLSADADRDLPADLWEALAADLQRLVLFGGKTAVYHACYMRDVAAESIDRAIEVQGWERFVERTAATLKRLAHEAAKSDIAIVVENIWHSEHAKSVNGFKDIILAADEPNVGIILDAGHANISGLCVGAEIRAAGKLLRDTHFHDNSGSPLTMDQHIPPGLGTIDWQDACMALNEINFPGPVVFEGVLGPGDSIENGRFGGALSHRDLIDITISNWRAFEVLAGKISQH